MSRVKELRRNIEELLATVENTRGLLSESKAKVGDLQLKVAMLESHIKELQHHNELQQTAKLQALAMLDEETTRLAGYRLATKDIVTMLHEQGGL